MKLKDKLVLKSIYSMGALTELVELCIYFLTLTYYRPNWSTFFYLKFIIRSMKYVDDQYNPSSRNL
jgi:hypothetical protein